MIWDSKVRYYMSVNGAITDSDLPLPPPQRDGSTVILWNVILRRSRRIYFSRTKCQYSVPDSAVAKNATVAADGKSYNVSYYNLDMIITVVFACKHLCEMNFWNGEYAITRKYADDLRRKMSDFRDLE